MEATATISTVSILEPAFGSFEMKDCSPSHDARSTARDFLDRIRNSAVTIRSQLLHEFQHHGAAENNQAHKRDVPRISQVKQCAENR